jgi:hypothetical protein
LVKQRGYGLLNIVAVIVLLGVSGCATGNYEQRSDSGYSGGALNISSQLRFEDVPVPAGFVLLRKGSYVFQNNQTRLGTLRYAGKSDVGVVLEFYKRAMTRNGWDLINLVEFDTVVLNFEKAQESCIVTLECGRSGKTMITLTLSPVSKGGITQPERGKTGKSDTR